MIRYLLTSSLVLLCGCDEWFKSNETDVSSPSRSIALSQETKEIIARCGAGISSSVGAGIEAKIGETLQQGAKVKGELYDSLEAAFIKNASVDNADALMQSM